MGDDVARFYPGKMGWAAGDDGGSGFGTFSVHVENIPPYLSGFSDLYGDEGRIRPGDLVVLAAFGTGFAWGATAIRW